MNNNLVNYIENVILSLYKDVDDAHNVENYIKPMIKKALNLCQQFPHVILRWFIPQ